MNELAQQGEKFLGEHQEQLQSEPIISNKEDDNNNNKEMKELENEEKKQDEINNQKDQGLDLIFTQKQNLIDEEKSKQSTCKNAALKVLYNFKDYFLMFCLFLSPSINFSYLSMPYILIGFAYTTMILSISPKSKKIKLIIEIALIAYSVGVLVVKIVFVSIPSNKFVKDNTSILIDLGMSFLKKKADGSNYNLFGAQAFVSDVTIIVISIISLIISICCRNLIDKQGLDSKPAYQRKAAAMIWLVYLIIVGLCCFNVCFFSLAMIILSQISLFVWAISEGRITIIVMKFCQAGIITLSTVLLILINIFNVISLRIKYVPYGEPKSSDSIAHLLSSAGIVPINPATTEEVDFTNGFINLGGYFFLASSIVLCATTFKCLSSRYIVKEENINQDLIFGQVLKKKKKDNAFINFLKNIGRYLQSPYFILHFCRIGVILWIYNYRNYPSLGLLVWLVVSFLILDVKNLKLVTFIIEWPCLLYTIWLFHYSNIKGTLIEPKSLEIRIKYEHIGLRLWKLNTKLIDYPFNQLFETLFMNLVVIFTTLFTKAFLNFRSDSDIRKSNPKEEDFIKGENLLKEIILDDGKKKKKKEKKKQKKKEVTLGNVLIRLIIDNIGVITLVVMYILSIYTVNIAHFILVIIFMIQLLRPKAIEVICYFILILVQLIFASEYIFDIIKVFIRQKLENEKFLNTIKFIFDYDKDLATNSIELVLLIAIYCFYIQHQNYHSILYEELINSKENTIQNYIEIKFKNYPKIRAILYFIGTVFIEIYVWVLIILCFFFISFFEVNILFSIKLFLFLLVCYQFLSSVQKSSANFHLCLNWVFLIYCAGNTVIVYFYQFTMLPLGRSFFTGIFESLFQSKNLRDNIPIIGIQEYQSGNLPKKFLPHFALNFLSVLFYLESKRILTQSKKEKEKERGKNMIRLNSQDSENKDDKSEEFNLLDNNDLQADVKKIKIEEKYNNNKKMIRRLRIKYYCFSIIVLLTKFYWLLLFNVVCIIFTSFNLSLSMIIYILIFGLTFIFMFRGTMNSLSNFISKPSFLLSKLIRKNLIEEPSHIEKTKRFRKIGFRFLLFFSMLFILLTYFYAVFDIFQNGCTSTRWDCEVNNHPIIEEHIEDYVQAVCYLIGIYINIRNVSIFEGIWVHILLIMLISFDAYVQKILVFFSDKMVEKDRMIKKIEQENSVFKSKFLHEKNILSEIGVDIANLDKRVSLGEVSPFIDNNDDVVDMLPQDKEESFSESINMKKSTGDDLLDKFYKIFRRAGKNKEDRYIKTSNNKVKFIQGARKLIEECIILSLLVIAIMKLNVCSYIYMLIVIYLCLTKKTMKKFYGVLIFLVIFTVIQAIVFLSNISMDTDPNPEKVVLLIVQKNLGIPWYSKFFNDSWGFFLSLGVNTKLQNILLILDFLLISLLYVYLDYFSYSLYQDDYEDMKKEVEEQISRFSVSSQSHIQINNNPVNIKKRTITNKFYNLTGKSKLIEAIKHLTPIEYAKHKENLQYTFGIELEPFEEFKAKFITNKKIEESQNENENENVIKPSPLMIALKLSKRVSKPKISINNKKKKFSCVKGLKKVFYLYLHNFVLTFIILISMMISGLISAVYITLSLIYLMKSSSLILGKKCDYPKAIKTFMRLLILVDILIQLIIQIPALNYNVVKVVQDIMKSVGISSIIMFKDSNMSSTFEVLEDQMILVFAKAFTFFIMSIQVVVYQSENFQSYYLYYILTKKDNSRKRSLVNVFWFNNTRIEQMNKKLEHRRKMKKAMDQLEETLEEWDKKLFIASKDKSQIMENARKEMERKSRPKKEEKEEEKEEKQKEDIKEETIGDKPMEKKEEEKDQNLYATLKQNPKEEEKEQKEIIDDKEEKEEKLAEIEENEPEKEVQYIKESKVKEKLRNHILERLLVKILIFIHKNNPNYTSVEKEERDDYIKNVIQGKTKLLTLIEKQVEIELNSLDLTQLTKKDLKEVKLIIDNANKLQKEEEEKAKREQKEIMNKHRKEEEEKKKEQFIPLEEPVISNEPVIEGLIVKNEEVVDTKNEEEKKEEPNQEKQLTNKKEDEEEKKKLGKIKSKQELELEKETIEREKYLNSPKILQFKRLVTKKLLFKKYLKTSYILKLILEDILYFISNNSHFLCYVMMIITHMVSGSLISLVYPLLIFCYGLYEYPRPNRRFWDFCIKYTISIIIIKFTIQLHFFTFIPGYKDKILPSLTDYKIGLTYYEFTFSGEFLKYIICDSILLFILLIHSYIMIALGIWNKTEQDIENIEQAYERIFTTKDLEIKNVKEFNNRYILKKSHESLSGTGLNTITSENSGDGSFDKKQQEALLKRQKRIKKLKASQKNKSNYFEMMFPKIRNQKPGSNFYPVFTIILMFMIVYIILFYTAMDRDRTFNSDASPANRQFSGSMVLFVFVHTIFAVIDRVIYLRQNRNNLEFDYIFYNKLTGEKLSNEQFLEIKEEILSEYPRMRKNPVFEIPLASLDKLGKTYNIVTIQKEQINYPLITKYVLNLVIMAFSHIFIFFIFPISGNINLNNAISCTDQEECNDFTSNQYLILFYLLYLAYLFISGLQVKYGYLDMVPKSLLKTGETTIHSGIFSGYKAIPFLYEIKLAIDWTFTKTSLDIFQWNKFESVYDTIYITLCSMRYVNKRPVGTKINKVQKILMGGSLFVGLLLVILVPLLIFSNLNPSNDFNNITGASISLYMSIKDGKEDVFKNYTLFKNEYVESLSAIDDATWNKYNYSVSTKTKSFPQKQVQVVKMSETSDTVLELPEPYIEVIKESLEKRDKDEVLVGFNYKFERPQPAEAKNSQKKMAITVYSRTETNEEYIEALKNIFNCKQESNELKIKDFYYPSIRLSIDPHPKKIVDNRLIALDIILKFTCKIRDDKIDRSNSYFQLVKEDSSSQIEQSGIEFHTFSDKVSSYTAGYNIITFYVTFVLLAGNYVRNFFAGQPEKIMLTEMPEPDKLINLCEGIKTSRYSFELEKEEQLYYVLIEFMRSPDYLKMLTKSSLRQFKERKTYLKKEGEEDL